VTLAINAARLQRHALAYILGSFFARLLCSPTPCTER
jgi:hypothetical protein